MVDGLLMLIHETAQYHRHEAVRAVLSEARQIALNVRRRLDSGSRRYVVAMVGLTNVGKSTGIWGRAGRRCRRQPRGGSQDLPARGCFPSILGRTGRTGIGRREQQFHRQLLAEVCDDVLVTGSEGWESRDRDRFRQRFAHELGQRLPRFHFVSGLEGLQARRSGDVAGLKQAGITPLEKRLGELANPRGRQAVQVANLLQLAGDLAAWLREYRDERGIPLACTWRPDSWGRWVSLAPDVEPKESLTRLLEVQP